MAQATLDQVISQLDTLQAEELQQLEDAVKERLKPTSEKDKSASEDKKVALQEAMLAAGLILHINPPRDPSKAERPLIEVQGEPVSETILRERR